MMLGFKRNAKNQDNTSRFISDNKERLQSLTKRLEEGEQRAAIAAAKSSHTSKETAK